MAGFHRARDRETWIGVAGGGGLDDETAQLRGIVGLRADECENELVVRLVEAGRIDDVGCLNGVDEIEKRHAGGL